MVNTQANMNDKNFSRLARGGNLPTLLSVHELAAYLQKSIRWVHLERSAGHLPQSLKIGRSRFWIAEDVAEWLKSNRKRGDENGKNEHQ